MIRLIRTLTAALLLTVGPATAAAGAGPAQPWVLVDTAADRLEVRAGDEQVLAVMDNLALGRGGVSDLHLYGDQTTPRGEYRVTRIDPDSRFHVFIGLDYPTVHHLNLARRRGVLDEARYHQLLELAYNRGTLPQDTALGGYIGLHGVGRGDPEIHARFHWTEGCVALTDEQIGELLRYVRRGTRVVIR
ncbi:MAG: L,D-transpeptidase [Arhodomonas sp.]|nr:L,D-transpeptidase [Arhodomonas sp.]